MTEELQREWIDYVHNVLFPQQLQVLADEEAYARHGIEAEGVADLLASVVFQKGAAIKGLGSANCDSSRAQIMRVTEGLLRLWRCGFFSLPQPFLGAVLRKYANGIQCVWIASGHKADWAKRETVATYADERELDAFLAEALARLPALAKLVIWNSLSVVASLASATARLGADAFPSLRILFMWHTQYTAEDLVRLQPTLPKSVKEMEVDKNGCTDWGESKPEAIKDLYGGVLRFH